MKEERFYNFPVQLMQAAPDIRKFCDDVLDYCIYKQSLTLSGDHAIRDVANYLKDRRNKKEYITEQRGRELYNQMPENAAVTGINNDLIWDFYNIYKTDHEVAVLMAFLALKSILGKKSYCRVTNEYLLLRMAGYNAKHDMPELPAWLQRYTSRRGMDSLKTDLQRNYGLKLYARYTRGFFVSFTLSLEELIKEVEMKRKKYYESNMKTQVSTAVSKVLKTLYR